LLSGATIECTGSGCEYRLTAVGACLWIMSYIQSGRISIFNANVNFMGALFSKSKDFLRPFIPAALFKVLKKLYMKNQLKSWEKNGRPAPPPHIVKQMTIQEYQQKYHCGVLVESGTFRGDMVEAQKKFFKKIISIELATELFEKAKRKFSKDPHVQILQGDSGQVLSTVMKDMTEPAVFWLDGHYSALETAKGSTECPIYKELDCILDAKPMNHVILIDDARDFTGRGDYPAVDALTSYIKNKNDRYQLSVENDIIRCVI